MPFEERRKYPRIAGSIPCQVSIGSSVLTAQTKNLSCGGILCELPQPIPLMSKLEIVLRLPAAFVPGSSATWVRCVGVVVRQQHQTSLEGWPSYLIAIYFSEIDPDDRRRIAEFILQGMLSYDRRRS